HREGGCAETAGAGIPSDPFLRGVRAEAEEFLLSIPQDPALSGLDEEWSVCMAGEGLSLRSPHEARESFMRDALAYLADGDHGGIDPFATPHALERAAEEKRVALADLECRELLDYEGRFTEIEHELQAAYVQAHRADVEAIPAALDERWRAPAGSVLGVGDRGREAVHEDRLGVTGLGGAQRVRVLAVAALGEDRDEEVLRVGAR